MAVIPYDIIPHELYVLTSEQMPITESVRDGQEIYAKILALSVLHINSRN
jgi:hypothetical protein